MTQSASGVRLRRRGSPDGCYEAVAPARNVRDVTCAIAAIKQRPAKMRDMNAKVSILHQQVRPHLVDQIPPRNSFPGALDQCNQDIERAAAERHRLIVSVQDASDGGEAKRSKGHEVLRPHNRIVRHEGFTCAAVANHVDVTATSIEKRHAVRLRCVSVTRHKAVLWPKVVWQVIGPTAPVSLRVQG